MTGRYLATKRSLMRLILLGLAGLSDYQDSPKGIQMCATCTLFEVPRSCKVVEGDISPNGWCRDYAMAD
jgi:hypothetical protein